MEPSESEAESETGAEPAVQRVVGAVGEPTRFRIVALLAARPHTVGELAEALGALQPQTTKHVQALEAAGVVRVHRLGRRRVAQLDARVLDRVAGYFAGVAGAARDAAASADAATLEAYAAAVAAEEARPAGQPRSLRFERSLAAGAAEVWAAWTDPQQAARWWAPRHFAVESFELEARPGGDLRVVLSEGGGASYRSQGRVEEVGRGRLVFSLAPTGPTGEPLFDARHTLELRGDRPTSMSLQIEISNVRPGAGAAVAGVEPGWNQLLDNLERVLGGR